MAQRGYHIPTLRPKYIPYTYMDPLGLFGTLRHHLIPSLATLDLIKLQKEVRAFFRGRDLMHSGLSVLRGCLYADFGASKACSAAILGCGVLPAWKKGIHTQDNPHEMCSPMISQPPVSTPNASKLLLQDC